MSKTILVVGGAGYVGAQTTKLLKKSGYKPVVFDNFSTGYRHFCKWGETIEGSLLSPDDLSRAFTQAKPVAVIHFAALTEVGKSMTAPLEYYQNNITGTLNLLEQMRQSNCKNIIFSSSCAVYGLPKKIPITENESLKPINTYGFTKFAMERALQDCERAYGTRWVALRYFNAAGADSDLEVGEDHKPESHLIPIALEVAAGKRPKMSVFGDDYRTKDGSCIRDYIHVEDLATAHVLALEYLFAGKKSMAFNLGTSKGRSVLEVIKTIEKVTGKKINYTIEDRRAGDPPALVADPKLAKKILKWKPKHTDLKVTVKHAWDWMNKK